MINTQRDLDAAMRAPETKTGLEDEEDEEEDEDEDQNSVHAARCSVSRILGVIGVLLVASGITIPSLISSSDQLTCRSLIFAGACLTGRWPCRVLVEAAIFVCEKIFLLLEQYQTGTETKNSVDYLDALVYYMSVAKPPIIDLMMASELLTLWCIMFVDYMAEGQYSVGWRFLAVLTMLASTRLLRVLIARTALMGIQRHKHFPMLHEAIRDEVTALSQQTVIDLLLTYY